MQRVSETQLYHVELSRKPKNIKMHNQKLVLNLLRNTGALSAADLAENTSLSKTTVMKILDKLQMRGMVISAGEGNSTQEGGRKPQLFQANAGFRYAVSLYISENAAHIGIIDFLGKIVAKTSVSFQDPSDADRSLKETAEGIKQLLAEKELAYNLICSIAAGVDGIVNAEKGIVYYPIHNPDWGKNIPVLDILKRYLPEFDVITIENSGRYSAYTLLSMHVDLRNKRVFSIQAGYYTGGCFFERGKIVRGANCFLGEIGHISVLPDDPDFPCECGNQGCFETVISPKAISYWAAKLEKEHGRTALSERLTGGLAEPIELFDAANAGDVFARLVVAKLSTFFVKLIRNIALLCDPEVVVISGLYRHGGKYFMEQLKNGLRKSSLFDMSNEIRLIYADLDINSCISGGGIYMIDQYIDGKAPFAD